ncbi:MAG TPA: ATP-dependent RecD-like DNA helicase [Clostridiales bacterium]|nr:ATP-dependent RecD-like DNA helicase [Clostridiales bacterium]
MSENLESIYGIVEYITYQNTDNGFTVIKLKTADGTITAVGYMPYIDLGEAVELTGRYDFHSSYGPQFRVEYCERRIPADTAGILRYLSSGAVKGIGPATARRIVEKFGEQALDIIEKDPERLTEIKGISLEKAFNISEDYKYKFGMKEVLAFLSRFNIKPEEALNIYKKLGNHAVEIINENPYILCIEDIGFDFERVDAIAGRLNFPQDSACRIAAGIEYVLRHNLSNGHTCLPKQKLIQVSSRLLSCQQDAAELICGQLLFEKRLIERQMDNTEFIFLPEIYNAELYCARRILALLQFPPDKIPLSDEEINIIEQDQGIKYAGLQRKAIKTAMEKGLLILTGGPGTGKTTTLNAIIKCFENKGLNIMLAAPTGRAAKRMSEVTGKEAKTIHRLLEVGWTEKGRPVFFRNEKNPLDCDVLIVDELSMVDVLLFENLLRAVRLGCRLVFVGDSDQLPSIGAGNVLSDLLAFGEIPGIKLTEVFRQAMESLIITNAHLVVSGKPAVLDKTDSDMFFIEQHNPRAAAKTTVDLCVNRLPRAYNLSPLHNIQVLCPSRLRELGTDNLNNMLQAYINPQSSNTAEIEVKGFRFREGDKVMQIKNNYEIVWTKSDGEQGTGIFNGDIGTIEMIDRRTSSVVVRFDDKVATYIGEELNQLELAYAITIHKSQGSEFDCVILPLVDVPKKLRYRNLLYTALTRAKKLLVVVGSKEVFNEMAQNHKKTLRYTALCDMLKELQ